MKKYMQGLLALLMLFGMNLEAARSYSSAKKAEEPKKIVIKKKKDKKHHKVKHHYKKHEKHHDEREDKKHKHAKKEKLVKHVKKEVNKEAHKAAALALQARADQELKEADKLEQEATKLRQEAKKIEESKHNLTRKELEKVKPVVHRLYKEEREKRSVSRESLVEADHIAKERRDLLKIESAQAAERRERAQELKHEERKMLSHARDHKAKMKEHAHKAGMKHAPVVHHPDHSAEVKAEEKMKKAEDKARHERRVKVARAQQKREDLKHKVGEHKYHRSHRDGTAQDLKDGSAMSMKKHISKRSGRISHR